MAIAMLSMDTIVARLQNQVPALRKIESAASLEYALKNGARSVPAAFVIPLSETLSNNLLSFPAIRQEVTVMFSVALCVQDFSDARGAAALSSGLEPVRQAILTALLGFAPISQGYAVTHSKGSLLQIKQGHLIWQDNFKTQFYRSSA